MKTPNEMSEKLNYANPTATIDRLKKLGAIAAVSFAALFAGTANETSKASTLQSAPKVEVFTPLYNGQAAVAAKFIKANRIDTVHASFALPNENGEIVLEKTQLEQLLTLEKNLGKTSTKIILEIGGAGNYDNGWNAAIAHPDEFASSALELKKLVEAEGGHLDGFGIDLEYSNYDTPIPADGISDLADSLHEKIPGTLVSAALPAYVERMSGDVANLDESLDTILPMTYDYHGYWDRIAGSVASGKDAYTSIVGWAKKLGSSKKILVGFPAYGYKYLNVKKDKTYSKAKGDGSILYNQIPTHKIKDDDKNLTSEALIGNAWISTVSPRIISKTFAKVRAKYSDVRGGFFWSTDGMTDSHDDAISN